MNAKLYLIKTGCQWRMSSAVNCFLNEWDGIEAIATGGDYDWDNNLIERINRHISLSRKNSMFFGSHARAERGCVFYSLACSCQLNRINFFEYFSNVLNRMAHMLGSANPEAFRDFLPDRCGKNGANPAMETLRKAPDKGS